MVSSWIDCLDRDLLNPIRRLAVVHPFYKKLSQGTLPAPLLLRYTSDTLWAVRDFAVMAHRLADGCPVGEFRGLLDQIAGEEVDHAALLGRTVDALHGSAKNILRSDTPYRPTLVYELWWRWVTDCVNHLEWHESVAVAMVGIENLARVQENIVGKALVEHYGLTDSQAEWFTHHGGEEEEEHGKLGLMILAHVISKNDVAGQTRIRRLIEAAAIPLLFHYPSQMLQMEVSEDHPLHAPAIEHMARLSIPYSLVKHPPLVESAHDFARVLGIPAERVFKTLLLKSKRGEYLLCSIPCTRQVDLHRVAELSGLKKLSMAPPSEILQVTGFESNRVSPFGQRQELAYFVDNQLFDDLSVYLGSGVPGADIKLSVIDLMQSLRPVAGDISRMI